MKGTVFNKLCKFFIYESLIVVCSVAVVFCAFPGFFEKFEIFLGILALGNLAMAAFSEVKLKNVEINRNMSLGTVSILISGAFFWCITAYFNDPSKYDFEWQPLLMSIFSILCFITFILVAVTFFTGKNILCSTSFFIFCPVLWFGLALILFLSIYNNHANFFEVTLTALLALYFVYHTQVFSTSSKANITKLMFVFGMPSAIMVFGHRLPIVIKYFQGGDVSTLSIAVSTLEIFIAIYILLHLYDSYRQVKKFSAPTIRTMMSN